MLACGPGLEAPTSFDDPPRAIGVVASNAVTALESIVAVHVSENTPAVWNYSSWK